MINRGSAIGYDALGEIPLSIITGAGDIPSAEAFGTPSISVIVAPDGIPSAEAFENPTLTPALAPVSIASAEAFGLPVVTTTTPAATTSGNYPIRWYYAPETITDEEALLAYFFLTETEAL